MLMQRIKILDPQLANQIAAGEVIERPASVIKELLENSLDAGSTDITIDIDKGGLQLIRITDNGSGIAKDDLALALSRHGTSKISTQDDLTQILTLGFRGEALASIAAISRIRVNSKYVGQETAWSLEVEGIIEDQTLKPIAHPQGTTIEVRDLFFNTPARRKFLRSEKTEFIHIENVVKRIALSHFQVRFQLNHNNRKILSLPKANDEQSKAGRIHKIMGKEFMAHAVKIEFDYHDMRLYGWVAAPQFHRASGDLQYFYVNGRMVRDKIIGHAVRQAFEDQLPAGRFPAFVLFFDVDPEVVDVNVHPTKHEVRFRETRLIHDFIYKALDQTLNQTKSLLPELESTTTEQVTYEPAPSSTFNSTSNSAMHTSNQQTSRAYHGRAANGPRFNVREQIANYSNLYGTKEKVDNEIPASASAKFLTLLANKVIIAEYEEQLLVIDIKKAKQYFIKARMKEAHDDGEVTAQPLLLPEQINVNAQQLKSYETIKDHLQRLAMDINIIGDDKLLVRALPDSLRNVNVNEFLSALLHKKLDPALTVEQLIETIADIAAEHVSSLAVDQRINLLNECVCLIDNNQKVDFVKLMPAEALV